MLENKDTRIIYTLSYGPKWCFIMYTHLDNQDPLIISTLLIGLNTQSPLYNIVIIFNVFLQ